MNPQEVLEFAKSKEVRQVDLRFTDLPGLQQHVSYPISQLTQDSFEEGFGIDGSSIRGWAAINESDMLLIPDASTAFIDPFGEIRTLVMTSDVIDPITRQHYERDPRWIARKAESYLKNSGLADTAYFGAEAEFFIFDNVRFDQDQHSGYYFIDAEEGRWNSGREGEQPGLPAALQGRLFPGSAHRSLPGPARRDGGDDDRMRDQHRVPSPRSGHRRPMRDRSALRHAD